MTKRVLLLIPEDLEFDALSEEQKQAIQGIFGQWVMPMPGTVSADGLKICDALCADTFDPTLMEGLDLSWPIIGMWQFDAVSGTLIEIEPLHETPLFERIPTVKEYDDNYNLLTETPPVLHEPHRWSGWPPLTLEG